MTTGASLRKSLSDRCFRCPTRPPLPLSGRGSNAPDPVPPPHTALHPVRGRRRRAVPRRPELCPPFAKPAVAVARPPGPDLACAVWTSPTAPNSSPASAKPATISQWRRRWAMIDAGANATPWQPRRPRSRVALDAAASPEERATARDLVVEPIGLNGELARSLGGSAPLVNDG